MPDIDEDELEVVSAYEKGKLKSAATKGELARLRAAARATGRLAERPAAETPRRRAPKRRSRSAG